MAKVEFNAEHKKVLDALLLPLPEVTAGKMFGYPAYYVHKKLIACVYGDGVAVKVPEDVANRLLTRDDVVPFQPTGRARMREWVQINRSSSEDYRLDLETFECAARYAGKLNNKGDGEHD